MFSDFLLRFVITPLNCYWTESIQSDLFSSSSWIKRSIHPFLFYVSGKPWYGQYTFCFAIIFVKTWDTLRENIKREPLPNTLFVITRRVQRKKSKRGPSPYTVCTKFHPFSINKKIIPCQANGFPLQGLTRRWQRPRLKLGRRRQRRRSHVSGSPTRKRTLRITTRKRAGRIPIHCSLLRWGTRTHPRIRKVSREHWRCVFSSMLLLLMIQRCHWRNVFFWLIWFFFFSLVLILWFSSRWWRIYRCRSVWRRDHVV